LYKVNIAKTNTKMYPQNAPKIIYGNYAMGAVQYVGLIK